MITFTDSGRNLMIDYAERTESRNFHISLEEATCVACRDQLRVAPGPAEPGDELFKWGAYVFSISKELIDLAGEIIIDSAGDLPVVYTKKSIDSRENY